MAKEFSRAERLGDQIQRELAVIVQRELKDPRVGMLSINAVRVSKDLGYADVYYSLVTSDELDEQSDQVRDTQEVLKHAAGFLRSQLGPKIKIRAIPQLRFHFDVSVLRGRAMSSLIDRALSEDNKHANLSDDEADKV